MKTLLRPLLAALCLWALSAPGMAQVQTRAYAPEDLRVLSYPDQVRVISLEYEEQSGGRRIPDDQLRFYLDQVNRSDWTFSRIKQDMAQSLAGPYRPGPGWEESIRCESTNGRSRTCPTPWPGRSRLARQLSETRCEEGRNWSSHRGQVTVWGGCRAEFIAGVGPGPGWDEQQSIRCESSDSRARTCATPWPGRSRLSRQLSQTRCVEGSNWSSQRGEITVWGGCRGEFVRGARPGGHDNRIVCESINKRVQDCRTPWRGRSRLIRQLSGASCVEGRDWKTFDGQVTVWDGCRAEFGPARNWNDDNHDYDDDGYSVTCSSNEGRYTTCHWAPDQGEPRLLQQLSQEPCVRGLSWGMNNRSTLWVSRGCRARFGN